MTDEQAYRLARLIQAWPHLGSVNQSKIEQLAGLATRPESPDAGRPWTPVLHTAEEIKR